MTHILSYSETFIETLDTGTSLTGEQVLLDRHERSNGEIAFCVKINNTEHWFDKAGEARIYFNSKTI